MQRHVVRWIGWFVVTLGLWFVLSDRLTTAEALFGTGAAALAATFSVAVQAQADEPLTFRARWLRPALGLPAQVVRDTGRVSLVLVRTLAGRPPTSAVVEEPIDPASPALHDQTALALLVAGRSAAPGTVVLDADVERRVLLVHRLEAP